MEKRNIKRNTKILLFTPGEVRARTKNEVLKKQDENNIKIEKFRKQLEEARKFRDKHFRNGIPIYKVGYLYELELRESLEGITRAYDLGYMMGYKAAQRQANEKRKGKV